MSTPKEYALLMRLIEKGRRLLIVKKGLYEKAKKAKARTSTIFFFKGEVSAIEDSLSHLYRVRIEMEEEDNPAKDS